MTGDQASWLRKNPTYRAIASHTPSGMRYIRRGMLHEDGRFDLTPQRGRPVVKPGSFEVGVLEEIQRGGMAR